MSRKGCRQFELKDDEILQLLLAENSDDEIALELDEEDQVFIAQDVDLGVSIVEIEDPVQKTLELSAIELEPQNIQQRICPTFKWKKNTYVPNHFPDVDYDFGEVQICGDREDRFLKPIEIFNETTNFEDLVTKIRFESIRYAEQSGTQFTVDNEELKAYLGMNLVMGYHILPSFRNYWSTAPDMAVPYISNA